MRRSLAADRGPRQNVHSRLVAARLALILLLVVGAGSCGDDDPPAPEPVPSRVVGQVVEVETEGDTVRGFVLEAEGRRYDIRIDPEIDYGFDLRHLREHLRLEQPVKVTLEPREDAIYATSILDA